MVRIRRGEAHVWTAPAAAGGDTTSLSAEGTVARERFHFDEDKTRYAVARSLLRKALSCCAPAVAPRSAFAIGP